MAASLPWNFSDAAKRRRLRQPDPDGVTPPPDYNVIFRPTPDSALTAVSHLSDDLERFWAGVVRLALTTDWKGEGSDSKRNPLLYLLASVGRGKTMFLREAARYVRIAAERHRVLQGATFLGVSFNGPFPLLPEELECVNFVGGYYLLLYVRILFCEMAFFGAAPADAFEHFVMQFYDELHAGRFSVGDVRREVRALIRSRARRGGPRSKVVLLVDEINNVLTSQVGASVCASYGMDLRYPLRSESRSLTDLVGGVTIMTSLEAGLMLAEQTASGRAALVVQEMEPPPFRLLVSLMFLALSQRPWDPRDVENLTMSVGSKRATMKLMECAEIYALAAGSTWRSAFFVCIMLSRAKELDFLDIMQAVDIRSSSGLLQPASANGLPKDLWSTTPTFRDAVLSSTILSQEVAADARVLPKASRSEASAAATLPPGTRPATWPAATGDDKRREEEAKKQYALGRLRKEEDLCYGDVRALGLITAGGDKVFQPELTCASLTKAVSERRESSELWEPFKSIMQVVSKKNTSQHDQAAAVETDRALQKLIGARWEQFFLRWEQVHSIAGCSHAPEYSAIKLRDLYGGGAAYVGKGDLLQDKRVNAAVAHTEVKKLRGAAASDGDRLETVAERLSGSYGHEERCKTVYELPANCPCFDGAIFFKALDGDGEAVIWVQLKIRGASALPASNIPAILTALNARKAELIKMLGGREQYDHWLPRSCYLYVLDDDLADAGDIVEGGDWTERSIIRTRGDLFDLFGRTFGSVGRLVRLLGEAGIGIE
ncbi:hypothetical protein I4F81_001020 [Pyropia yezoensis]|uniref:Uncharacterized protein n=1 Tax=Pyropia yezoensis TaxID=2788 RepID=A0ACC3BKF3_PYRYE|nr:hypothetical protein I4F81_001020 [Neopyropia yezoensis]